MKHKYIELVEKDEYQYVTRLIGKRGAVVIIPLKYEGFSGSPKIQLILSTRPTFDKPILEFPAGLLDDDNETIENTIHRELKEETGWTCDIDHIVGPCPSSAGLSDEALYIATVLLEAPGENNLQGDEKIKVLPLMDVQDVQHYIDINEDKIYVSSRVQTYLEGLIAY